MEMALEWTPHAERRSRQRRIPPAVVETVLQWGREIRQPDGRYAYFVGRRDLKRAARSGVDVHEALSVAVITKETGVITVIRTQDVSKLRRFGKPWRPTRYGL